MDDNRFESGKGIIILLIMLQKLSWLAIYTAIAFVVYMTTDAKWYVYLPLVVGAIFILGIIHLVGAIIFTLTPSPKDQHYKNYMDIQRKVLQNDPPIMEYEDGWVLARPLPFYCFKYRLRQAWDVLRYKADAFYYHGQ